jgi:hypothetical protein
MMPPNSAGQYNQPAKKVSRKLFMAVGVIASVCVVGALVARHEANSETPFALLVQYDLPRGKGGREWRFMAATRKDCEAIAAGVRVRMKQTVGHVKIECVPESDGRLNDQWRIQKRRLGRYRDHMVYLYGRDRSESVTGAYFLAIPGETHGSAAEIDGVFPDRENCEHRLDLNKSGWKDDREFKDSADYKNSAKFKTPEYTKIFDEDERKARGVCAPVQDPEKLKCKYCDDLPFKIEIAGGSVQYGCDYEALQPQSP